MSSSGINALRARAAAANAAVQNKSYIKPGATVGQSASTGITNNDPFRAAIGAMPKATPFYVAAPGTPSAPMSESSSARRAAQGLPPEVHGGLAQIAKNANAAIANSTYVKTSPNYKPAGISASAAPTTSSRTVTSAPAPSAPSTPSPTSSSTPTVDSGTPAPTPTTSGGTGGTVSGPSGPQAANYGGSGRGAGREGAKTNRRNPRAAKSTTMDELKKQAAKRLGV